jgi:hypothetical protein
MSCTSSQDRAAVAKDPQCPGNAILSLSSLCAKGKNMGWLVLALVFMLAITVGYGLRRFYRRWVWGRTRQWKEDEAMKYGGGAMQVPGIRAGSGGVDDVMRDRCDTLKEFVARFKDSLIWGPYQKTSFRHGIYTALPYFLAAVGALVSPFGGMVVAGFSGSGADPTVIQTFSILSPVFSIVSLALFYFGMRMLQPHLEALKLQNVLVDPRSPVLFLRGFSRDGEVFDDPTKLPLLLPQRWSPEEIVCHILQTVGPVVAGGLPAHPIDCRA